MQADVDAIIQRCLSGAEAAALPQKAVKIVASSIAAVSIIIQELGLLKKITHTISTVTWLSIGWQLYCQPIRSHVYIFSTNTDFNMEIS